MTNLRYLHVLSEFAKTPWAIEEEKLRVMEALLMLRAQGGQLNEEEIEARVGGRDAQRQPRTQNAVAVLPVYGVINNRMNLMSDMSGGTSIEKLTSQFRDALADPQITGIVFDVDSPGGGVFGVQELADEIFAARGQKKMVAQVNPLAASAAYWLATAADEVAITPSGRAGSIGVFSTHQDISKMLESEGIKVTLTSAGKYKTEGNQFEPLSDEAKAYLQQSVDQYYAMFVGAVAKGRGVTQANVKAGFGQGRVLSAQDALTAGMVDRIATLDQTIEAMLGGKPASTTIAAQSSREIAHRESHTSSEAQPATETPATAETTTEAQMSTAVNPAAAAATLSVVAENAIKAEESRVAAILSLARSAGMPDKGPGWARENKSVDAVLAEINGLMENKAKAIRVPEPGAQIALTDREQKQYSMLHGIQAACRWTDKGFEHEVSDTLSKKLGKTPSTEHSFWMPTNLRMHYRDGGLTSERAREQYMAVLQGTTGQQPGSNLVQTTILPSEFIELLRNMQVCMRLGARKLGDLQGNIQLPKQTGPATLYWTGENPGSAVTPADQAFTNIQATPHQAMAQTLYSRQFLIQSSLDADQLIREDFAAIFALGLDLAALVGTGTSNQPKGISNQTGVNTLACGTNGGAITYALCTQAQALLEQANIPLIRPGVVTTPQLKNAMRNKSKLANTIALPIWGDDNEVGGYPALSSNQMPSTLTKGTGTNLSMMTTGDWYQLIFAEWGAMEIIADPYTQAGKGNVVLTPSMLVDVIVRYANAFTVISDADPTL